MPTHVEQHPRVELARAEIVSAEADLHRLERIQWGSPTIEIGRQGQRDRPDLAFNDRFVAGLRIPIGRGGSAELDQAAARRVLAAARGDAARLELELREFRARAEHQLALSQQRVATSAEQAAIAQRHLELTERGHALHVISARETAVVLALSVAVGDRVAQGQTIALLESPAFVGLQQEFLQALSERDLARELAEREQALAAEGVIAGRRGLESRARLRELEARLEAQRQALVLAGMSEADLRTLSRQRTLSPTVVVRSSFAGVVLEQSVRVGERVDAGAPLYRLGQIDELNVEVHSPLEHARDLEVGSPIEVVGSEARGRVLAIGREIHPVDQGIVVRGVLEDPAGELRPGQFVRVRLSVPAAGREAYRIPSAAVVRVGDRSWVFVAESGGFRPAEVEILGGSGRWLVVSGPPLEGTNGAVGGTASLKSLWLGAGGT